MYSGAALMEMLVTMSLADSSARGAVGTAGAAAAVVAAPARGGAATPALGAAGAAQLPRSRPPTITPLSVWFIAAPRAPVYACNLSRSRQTSDAGAQVAPRQARTPAGTRWLGGR